jgi:formate hydrogenlyase subunit 6/NADH:ubiquinone oxidoreductase subunit I
MIALLERADLDELVGVLRRRGFAVIAPTVKDGAVVCREITSTNELPAGWVDEQEAGRYRLHQTDELFLFGYTVGPIAWKRFLFPPDARLFRTAPGGNGALQIAPDGEPPPRYAFLGVRGCDLAAITIQDHVFMRAPFVDRAYHLRRQDALVIAVHCTRPGATCFCASMGTGPRAAGGYDLALSEVVEDGRHYFIAESGSPRGEEILAEVPHRGASPAERHAADAAVDRAAGLMGRAVDLAGLKELLYGNYDHPRWDDVAGRCLACANCTLVCPTCFCTSAEERTDLEGTVEHGRRWDSCFSASFSYIHGGSIRPSVRARYRQWLVHKFAAWIDQFGTSGCVGCGRCITWCPAGIDVTEELRAIRGLEVAAHGDA